MDRQRARSDADLGEYLAEPFEFAALEHQDLARDLAMYDEPVCWGDWGCPECNVPPGVPFGVPYDWTPWAWCGPAQSF